MPDHCCVPSCRSNYKGTTDYISVFRFPKNPALRELWLQKIRREDFVPGERAVVCERHFPPEMIIRFDELRDKKGNIVKIPRKVRRLTPGAYPYIFPATCGSTTESKSCENVSGKLGEAGRKRTLTFDGGQNKKSPLKCLSIPSLKRPDFSEPNAVIVNSKSPKKSCTTNRPIITIVKAEGVNGDKSIAADDSEKDIEELKIIHPEVNSDSRLLSAVTDANQDEKRKSFKEYNRPKKRSSSVGSNSSGGSVETTKSISSPKRRKIEKIPPTVSGRDNDCYCWVCHKEGVVLCCISCPRAYHLKCAGEVEDGIGWVCIECRRVLSAENVDSRSTTLSKISLNKLCALLKLSLNKMKFRAPAAFHQPVPVEYYPSYPEYVIHPVDLSLVEKNIKQNMYGCTESFLADVKWILHNSSVFNGTQHPLSTNAKSLVKTCEYDMGEIEVCPDCYMHSCIRSKYWFSDVCSKPHPLVWAKLKGFPYWPAKVVRIVDGNVDARFFGAHDRAWVPVSQCYHLSKEMPTSSKPKKKGTYDAALDELNVHVQLLIQKFGDFIYAPYRTLFNPENKLFAYHGIDIDKVFQGEDDSFDPTSINFKQLPTTSSVPAMGVSKQEEPKTSVVQEDSIPDIIEHKPDKPPSPKFSASLLSSVVKQPNIEKKSPPVGVFEVSSKSYLETPQRLELLNTPLEIKLSPAAFSSNNQKIVSALERIKEIVSNENEPEDENKAIDSSPEGKVKVELDSSVTVDVESVKIHENIDPDNSQSVAVKCKLQDNESEMVELSSSSLNSVVPVLPLKKGDLFAMKLDETIESCKAKLGITDISEHETSSSESGEEEEEEEEESEDESDNESMDSEAEEVIDLSNSVDSEVGNKGESSDTDADANNDFEETQETPVSMSNSSRKSTNGSVEDAPCVPKTSDLPIISDEAMIAVSSNYDTNSDDVKEIISDVDKKKSSPVEIGSPSPKGTDSGCSSLSPTNHSSLDDSSHVSGAANQDPSGRNSDEMNFISKVGEIDEKISPQLSKSSVIGELKDASVSCCEDLHTTSHLQDVVEKMQCEMLAIKQNLQSLKLDFKKQQWFHMQENSELHHNMNILMLEMRASFETDRKKMVDSIKKQHETEKKKICAEMKRKQWCANCQAEAVFFCCWNTNYCSVTCQRSHWLTHMHQCKRSRQGLKASTNVPSDLTRVINGKLDVVEVPDTPPVDKKLIFLSVKPELLSGKLQSSSSPLIPSAHSCDATSDLHSQSQPVAPQIQFVTSNSPLQLITSNSKLPTPLSTPSYPTATNSALQFLLSPIPTSSDPGNRVVSPEIVRAVQDSSDIITKVRSRQTDLGTAIDLINEMNKETAASIPKGVIPVMNPEDAPDPTVTIGDNSSDSDDFILSDGEQQDNESVLSGEESVSENQASDSNSTDDLACQRISFADGVEVDAKAVKRCLKFGTTPTKFIRRLIDTVFPDISVLAKSSLRSCKGRSALPQRQVQAIIDQVKLRYTDCAESDIEFQLKMKCKEARIMLRRVGTDNKSLKPEVINDGTIDTNAATDESSLPGSEDCSLDFVFRKSAVSPTMLRERPSVQFASSNNTTVSTSQYAELEDTKNLTAVKKSSSDVQSPISHSQSSTVPAAHSYLNGSPLVSLGSPVNSKVNQGGNLTQPTVNKTRSLLPKPQLINTLPLVTSVLPISTSANVTLKHSPIISHSFQASSGGSFVTTDLTNLQCPPLDQKNPHPVLVLGRSTLSAALQFGSKSPQVRLTMPVGASMKLTNSPSPILPSLLKKGTGESSGIS